MVIPVDLLNMQVWVAGLMVLVSLLLIGVPFYAKAKVENLSKFTYGVIVGLVTLINLVAFSALLWATAQPATVLREQIEEYYGVTVNGNWFTDFGDMQQITKVIELSQGSSSSAGLSINIGEGDEAQDYYVTFRMNKDGRLEMLNSDGQCSIQFGGCSRE